jgi:hypothetical protein
MPGCCGLTPLSITATLTPRPVNPGNASWPEFLEELVPSVIVTWMCLSLKSLLGLDCNVRLPFTPNSSPRSRRQKLPVATRRVLEATRDWALALCGHATQREHAAVTHGYPLGSRGKMPRALPRGDFPRCSGPRLSLIWLGHNTVPGSTKEATNSAGNSRLDGEKRSNSHNGTSDLAAYSGLVLFHEKCELNI